MGKVWSSLQGNLKYSSSCIRAYMCTHKTSTFLEGDDLREGKKNISSLENIEFLLSAVWGRAF